MSNPPHTSHILSVALDVPLDRTFDYLHKGTSVKIGQRVVVPFAGRRLVGVVMAIQQHSDIPLDKLKTIIQLLDDVVLDTQLLPLLKFCADYYHYPFGQLLISTLPLRLRQIKPAVSRKSFEYYLIKPVPETRIESRQLVLRRLVDELAQHGTLTEHMLSALSSSWRKWLQPLVDEGYVTAKEVIAVKPSVPTSGASPVLNAEQTAAIDTVLAALNAFKPWLLYGITGSGKTEVYIQLLAAILAEPNAQALVLVPEINLTPQLEARFRSRLSQYTLVTLHSNLSESERLQNWLAAKSGSAKIVIGTRLSVFTPMPNLKLLIIDEEHDGSYKQQDGMRYHARDVAMVRAKQLNIPIVLGSATPSLETWYNATASHHKKQNYGLITLTQRAVTDAALPDIKCIDIAKSPVEQGLSPILIQAIRDRLSKQQQSLLFINRRGYAPVLHCASCQWHASCMRCSAKLVVHLSQRRLKCHHCGHEQKIPMQCPSCGNADIKPVGQATQRLTQTLAQLFPDARIARVDRDSMRNKDALTDMLSKVHAPLYTKSRFEKVAYENLLTAGYEAYLPLHRTLRQWSDRKKWVEAPLFSSYVFAKIEPKQVQNVLLVRGITRFIYFNGQPASMRDKDIELIKKLLESNIPIEIEDGLPEIGEYVTLKEGVLAGYTGKVTGVSSSKIIVELEEFNKSIIVYLNEDSK